MTENAFDRMERRIDEREELLSHLDPTFQALAAAIGDLAGICVQLTMYVAPENSEDRAVLTALRDDARRIESAVRGLVDQHGRRR